MRFILIYRRNMKTNAIADVPCEGFFVAIGHSPNTEMVKGVLSMDEAGYLRHKPESSETEIPGIFVAGDVHDIQYRQAVTAAGAGCRAAIDCERWLEMRAHARSGAK